METGLLSNDWWSWVLSNYTVTIGLISSLIVALLKIIAVLHPCEQTNSIVGLLQGWLFGFPGAWDGRERRK